MVSLLFTFSSKKVNHFTTFNYYCLKAGHLIMSGFFCACHLGTKPTIRCIIYYKSNVSNTVLLGDNMSNVYFISDLHLGHKKILDFEPSLRFGDTVEEHDHILIERIRSVCNSKRDTLYICGDIAMKEDKLELLDTIPARKILIRGNHDLYADDLYRKYFDRIMGLICYKGHWVSHAPIHPDELRGRRNIHGHVHSNSIREPYEEYYNEDPYYDDNYINVCVENCAGYPINFNDIRDKTFIGEIK